MNQGSKIKDEKYKIDEIAQEIITDINLTFGSSTMFLLGLVAMGFIIFLPIHGFEDLDNRFKTSLPVIGAILSNLGISAYYLNKFREKKDLRSYVIKMLINNEVNVEDSFKGINKVSFIKIIAMLRSRLDMSQSKDEGDYLSEMVSKLLES